jgi:hypothetical protein
MVRPSDKKAVAEEFERRIQQERAFQEAAIQPLLEEQTKLYRAHGETMPRLLAERHRCENEYGLLHDAIGRANWLRQQHAEVVEAINAVVSPAPISAKPLPFPDLGPCPFPTPDEAERPPVWTPTDYVIPEGQGFTFDTSDWESPSFQLTPI